MIWRSAIFAALLANSANAATLGEEERFQYNALVGSDFEVIRLQHMGAAELWCAAASYVERRKRLPGTTAIYVKTPLGPSRTTSARKSVVFSLSNVGLPTVEGQLTLTVAAPGATLKAAVARRYCRDAFTRSTK